MRRCLLPDEDEPRNFLRAGAAVVSKVCHTGNLLLRVGGGAGGGKAADAGQVLGAGMIVGQCNRNEDMSVNVCKKKQLTNMRAAGSDEAIRLAPPKILSLEQCMEYLADDELLEVTPKSLRMRKRILDHSARMRAASKAKS